jgi:AcrR family transcriptional regulator
VIDGRTQRGDLRKDLTRTRLIEAAVDLLVAQGLDGFTTPAVAQAAGVAQGTVFRHFPTKQDLLVTTTAAALESCRSDHADRFAARAHAEQPATTEAVIRLAIESLWAACTDPRATALIEVRARCRTDDALRAQLDAVIGAENEVAGDLVTILLPATFDLPADDYLDLSRIVLNALQGRALARLVRPDPERDRAVVESLIALARERYADRPARRVPTPSTRSSGAEP